jgi:hypothetical protein
MITYVCMTNNFTYYFITYGCKGEQTKFFALCLGRIKTTKLLTENINTKRIQKMKI